MHIAEELFGDSKLEGESLYGALVEIFKGETYEGLSPEEMAEAARDSIIMERMISDENDNN